MEKVERDKREENKKRANQKLEEGTGVMTKGQERQQQMQQTQVRANQQGIVTQQKTETE